MRFVVAFAGALVVACSSGGSGGSSTSGSGGSDGVAATCGDANKSVIESTSGGQTTTVTADTRSWGWVNIGKPSHFDGGWDGGSIHLEWPGTIANGEVADLSAATLTQGTSAGAFKSGKLVYDSPDKESILKASIVFDTGTVTVCMRKTD